MSNTPLRPDKRQMRAAFEQSAAHYDAVAILQREVADRLLERLDLLKMTPATILDLGSGTGYCSEKLATHYPRARITALDLADTMVQRSRGRFSRWSRLRRGHQFVCGDAEALPFADQSFDMLFSNLTIQWGSDLETTFSEMKRVLRPGGVVLYTTLGPDTLRELRASWAAVDEGVHVNTFLDMHDVGDAMLRARLAEPVMDMEHLTITYEEAMTLMRDLKTLGAHNVNPGRRHGLTSPKKLKSVLGAYEQFRRSDGLLPASYEVVYGHAWRAEQEDEASPHSPGEFAFSLDRLRGNHE
ncbi:MAG: malonyl-ACP O-methyltransferase BioC [Gammaproteobacteria bacterium]|nr:malonyl-ACP O-methyltransferase BioC [Gammaproteobacteria bacterium]